MFGRFALITPWQNDPKHRIYDVFERPMVLKPVDWPDAWHPSSFRQSPKLQNPLNEPPTRILQTSLHVSIHLLFAFHSLIVAHTSVYVTDAYNNKTYQTPRKCG